MIRENVFKNSVPQRTNSIFEIVVQSFDHEILHIYFNCYAIVRLRLLAIGVYILQES